MFTYLALVSPPVALALDVFAWSVAEIGRADDDDLDVDASGAAGSDSRYCFPCEAARIAAMLRASALA
jgi:hypothetical protein